MHKEKDCIRALAREVSELVPMLYQHGYIGSANEYAAFLQVILVGFSGLLTTERTVPTLAERALLREIADNPLITPLAVRYDIESLMRCPAG